MRNCQLCSLSFRLATMIWSSTCSWTVGLRIGQMTSTRRSRLRGITRDQARTSNCVPSTQFYRTGLRHWPNIAGVGFSRGRNAVNPNLCRCRCTAGCPPVSLCDQMSLYRAYVLYDLARLLQWPVEGALLSGLFLLATVTALVAVWALYWEGRKS